MKIFELLYLIIIIGALFLFPFLLCNIITTEYEISNNAYSHLLSLKDEDKIKLIKIALSDGQITHSEYNEIIRKDKINYKEKLIEKLE